MPTTIKLKNSVTTTNAPSSLVQGEVAINITDKKVWVGNAATTPIQLLGAGASINLTSLTTSNDCSISGLTVGKGLGSATSNTAVGLSALATNTSGTANSGFGAQALQLNTTGSGNAAFGGGDLTNYNATLKQNTTGSNNSAFGIGAMGSNTTGGNNTGIGFQSLVSNTTASNNTAVGYQAGFSNTTGNMVAVGKGAGYTQTTATSCTYVGTNAGYLNSTGVNNTFVGDTSGYNTTGGNNTFIGVDSGYLITSGTKNTIVGKYNGNQDGLDIRTTSNYAVISDGDGNRLLSTYNGGTLALDGGAVPQAGTGITFPATQSASSDANTLDDYEEGSFTPSFSNAGTYTYSRQYGRYTKTGRTVNIYIDIIITSQSGGSGTPVIQSIPFASGSGTTGQFCFFMGGDNNWAVTRRNLIALMDNNATSITCYTDNGSNIASFAITDIGQNGRILISGSYFV